MTPYLYTYLDIISLDLEKNDLLYLIVFFVFFDNSIKNLL